MWPSVIAVSAVPVNVLVNGMFASQIDGGRSYLNFAFRLMYLPIGVFGVAIATATLPAVARLHARDDLAGFGRTVEESLRLMLYLVLPAAAGLFALAPEIIGTIYQHGAFLPAYTEKTAQALRAFSIGLAGYAAIKVVSPCFIALEKPRIPLMVSLLGIGVNVVANLVLVKMLGMGHVGVALSTAILALVNSMQLLFYLRREVKLGVGSTWFDFSVKIGISALFSAGLAFYAAHAAAGLAHGFAGRVLSLSAGLVAGIACYFIPTILLNVPETHSFLRLVRGKLSPRDA
jgi:putative peptidoglycan lipid II flippase